MICVNSVRVTPGSVTLQAGKWYYGARAEVCPLNASCRSVRWWSENPNVASVNASSGYIYARAAGTVTIWATAIDGSGCRDCMTVLVKSAIPVESVELVPGSLSMETGSSYLLSAVVCPVNATKKSVTWCSSNTGVATVSSSGRVTAVSKGSAIITATANDGSGKCGCCQVAVTGDALVRMITVSKSSLTLIEGKSSYLSCTVYPTYAANQTVVWSSSNIKVATVVPNTGLVMAQNVGSATITATAQDGSGVTGTCIVKVTSPVRVNGICVKPASLTIRAGENKQLNANIFPSNATNRSVKWSSNKSSIATVTTGTGVVTGVSDGTATITAVPVDNSQVSSTCIVHVDSREVVTVRKEIQNGYDFFKATFPNGKVWKSVERDMTSYDQTIHAAFLNRANQNATQDFDNNELAYLYRLDPHGVAHYVKKYYQRSDKSDLQILKMKDDIFRKIFVHKDDPDIEVLRYFNYLDNGTVGYYIPGIIDDSNRLDVYSYAEIIFGYHTRTGLYALSNFLSKIMEELFTTLVGLIPGVSQAQELAEWYQALFFSGSIVGKIGAEAKSYLMDRIDEQLSVSHPVLNWCVQLLDSLQSIANTAYHTFVPQNTCDLPIYLKMKEQNYRTELIHNGIRMSMEDIVDRCVSISDI